MVESEAVVYRIRVKETVGRRWESWFEGISLEALPGEGTVISGLMLDQAALHGWLNKVRDLGLTLISVERVDEGTKENQR